MTGSWQERADELAAESIAAGNPTGWFDTLFAEGEAGLTTMPWDRSGPQPLLASWAAARVLGGGRAAVPGCGLGADAAFVAGLGFETLGFDVAPTAVRLARERFGSVAEFREGDLLALPSAWRGAFDLVVDVYTVQAMPRTVREPAIEAIAGLVAPGGTLLAIQAVLPAGADPDDGPPFPLTRDEFAGFGDPGTTGLLAVSVETVDGFWRGEFRRAAAQENVGAVQQDGDRG